VNETNDSLLRYALDLDYDEWGDLFEEMGEPRFRADQVCRWLWGRGVSDPAGMTDLSKELRPELARRFVFAGPEVLLERRSRIDATRKFLLRLRDGERIETVLLGGSGRRTLCASTQVGCALGCPFCATGRSGFVRDLSSGEIAGQFLLGERLAGGPVDNLVLMGMGEPLLNFDATLKAIRCLNHPKMRNLGNRRITLSTAGVVPGIHRLAESGQAVRLAVSLHAPSDELRNRLVPVNRTWPLALLMEALRTYQARTGDRITIEYALLSGENDAPFHARELARLLEGLSVYVNLIPANGTGSGFRRALPKAAEAFRTILGERGIEAEIRKELGADIDAACGQLRLRDEKGEALPGAALPGEEPTGEEPAAPPARPSSGGRPSGQGPRKRPPEARWGGSVAPKSPEKRPDRGRTTQGGGRGEGHHPTSPGVRGGGGADSAGPARRIEPRPSVRPLPSPSEGEGRGKPSRPEGAHRPGSPEGSLSRRAGTRDAGGLKPPRPSESRGEDRRPGRDGDLRGRAAVGGPAEGSGGAKRPPRGKRPETDPGGTRSVGAPGRPVPGRARKEERDTSPRPPRKISPFAPPADAAGAPRRDAPLRKGGARESARSDGAPLSPRRPAEGGKRDQARDDRSRGNAARSEGRTSPARGLPGGKDPLRPGGESGGKDGRKKAPEGERRPGPSDTPPKNPRRS